MQRRALRGRIIVGRCGSMPVRRAGAPTAVHAGPGLMMREAGLRVSTPLTNHAHVASSRCSPSRHARPRGQTWLRPEARPTDRHRRASAGSATAARAISSRSSRGGSRLAIPPSRLPGSGTTCPRSPSRATPSASWTGGTTRPLETPGGRGRDQATTIPLPARGLVRASRAACVASSALRGAAVRIFESCEGYVVWHVRVCFVLALTVGSIDPP